MSLLLGFALIVAPVACGQNCDVLNDPCAVIEQSISVADHSDAESEHFEQITPGCVGCGIQIMSHEDVMLAQRFTPSIPFSKTEPDFNGLSHYNYLRPPRV